MIIYNKSSYNHCEKIFDSKNKLYNYIRSHEYVIISFFAAKSISFHEFNLLTFVSIKSIALKVTIILTFTFAIKSIVIYKINLSPFFTSETTFNDTNIAIKKREIKYYVSRSDIFFRHKDNTFYNDIYLRRKEHNAS